MRNLALSLALVALVAPNSSAGAAEPGLVVEKLSDPDPGFVPPPPEKHAARPHRRSSENPTLDEAFENLGRVAGQAAQMAEQSARADRQKFLEMAAERAKADRQKLIQMACKAIDDARSSGLDVSRWEKDC